MAWGSDSAGVPYHPLIAPELAPTPHVAKGDMLGGSLLNAFVSRAIASEKAQLDQQQLIQNADIEAKRLDLATTAEKHNYELKKEYYSVLGSQAGEVQNRRLSAMQRTIEENTRREQVNDELIAKNDKIKEEPEYKFISDQSNLDKDPVGYWANYRRFQENHASDVMSIAPDIIKQVKPLVDQQKIPFREGARWTPGGKIEVDGKTKTMPGQFETKDTTIAHVPVWQISERYANADAAEREQILHGLMAAGQTKLATSIEKFHEKDSLEGDREMTRRKNVFSVSDKAQKILDAGTKTDFSHGKDTTPEIFTEKYKKGGAMGVDYSGSALDQSNQINNDAVLPEPELPPLAPGSSIESPDGIAAPTSSAKPVGFAPTSTDMTLQQARAALAANPGARDEIVRRLQGMNINPSLLA